MIVFPQRNHQLKNLSFSGQVRVIQDFVVRKHIPVIQISSYLSSYYSLRESNLFLIIHILFDFKRYTLYQNIQHHYISSYIHVSFYFLRNLTTEPRLIHLQELFNVIEHNKFFYNDTYYPYINRYNTNTQS